jgi:lysophospholipid acyltransferase (LPLAT)-like uncharacterized protein
MSDRTADGVRPGTFKVEDGIVYVANVMPVKIGPDEYETRVRWHKASWKDQKRYRREAAK